LKLEVAARIESQHMPVLLKVVDGGGAPAKARAPEPEPQSVPKVVWQDELKGSFLTDVQSAAFAAQVETAHARIAGDPDGALDSFAATLMAAADPMKKSQVAGGFKTRGPPWFDREYRQSKQSVKSLLRQWRSTKSGFDRVAYVTERTRHAGLLKEKKAAYERSKSDELTGKLSDQQSFWKLLKKLNSGGSNQNKITMEEWVEHLKTVFGTETFVGNDDASDDDEDGNVDAAVDDYDIALNRDITLDEVCAAIRNLKNGKAAGEGGVLGEMLKNATHAIDPFLCMYFNHLFKESIFPTRWARAILVPLLKKGNVNDTNNYRGISLLSILSKCYTYVLNKRLEAWAEGKETIVEEQGGFRKGRSTVDHIFVMQSMVEQALAKTRGKLYVAFVDFSKVYDLVHKNVLWSVLRRARTSGRMLGALKAMYSSVVASVRANGVISEEFTCPVGLKQGECTSPILFPFLINELAVLVTAAGRHGVQFLHNVAEVFLLLFADDVALVSITPVGLQRQLNSLKSEADRLKLEVNLDKTKVIVFRKGGPLAEAERWWYDGVRLEVVNAYKYIGLTLTTRLSVPRAVGDFVPKAKRKVVCILNALTKINCTDWKVFCKTFDCQVRSGLLYASEIWGTVKEKL
jgi:hypothetical protein